MSFPPEAPAGEAEEVPADATQLGRASPDRPSPMDGGTGKPVALLTSPLATADFAQLAAASGSRIARISACFTCRYVARDCAPQPPDSGKPYLRCHLRTASAVNGPKYPVGPSL